MSELGGQSAGGNNGENTGGSSQPQGDAGGSSQAGGQSQGGSQGTGSWLDTLPTEFKENASIKGFKSVEDLAKSYIHAQSMIGADKVIVPGKSATDKDWEGVFSKLGRPESPDKYELKASEKHDQEFLKSFKEVAHKSGLLPKQVENLYNFYGEVEKKQQEMAQVQMQRVVEANIQELKKEWPDSDYERNLGVAKKAVDQFLGDDGKKWLNESGIGNDPQMIKFMHKLGVAMSEDRIKGEGGVSLNESRESAQSKLNEILGNSKHPYFDGSHPNHEFAVKEVNGYYAQIYKK
jgi:hypothetical protein